MTVEFFYGPFEVEAELSAVTEGDSSIPNGTRVLYEISEIAIYANGEECSAYLRDSVIDAIEEAAVCEID
jgi:hypothetical protein